jgi:hypothetical protein
MYLQTRADLSPFTGAGASVLPGLNALSTSGLTGGGPDYLAQAAGERPLQMTQAELEATPGYQFTRDQGLKAVQSAAASRGLGMSGASLRARQPTRRTSRTRHTRRSSISSSSGSRIC